MMRTMRGRPTTWLQSKGKDEPETIINTPHQEGHPDTAKGRDIADYTPDIDYEGSEPKVEPVAQEQREVDPDEEYAKMEMPRNGTLSQSMLSQEVHMGILRVHKAQGPEIMASWLQDMYIRL